MNSEANDKNIVPQSEENRQPENPDRRDLMEKFGKFAAYAAPFTVLALTQKADAATGRGPGRH